MIVKLLTEHHLEFVSLKGGCTGSSESTPVKMSNCWKSHAAAQLSFNFKAYYSKYRYDFVVYPIFCKRQTKYITIKSTYPHSL